MTEHALRVTADALLQALLDARSVERELLDGLTESQYLRRLPDRGALRAHQHAG